MALNKSKKKLILSLKIQIIGIYILLDLILWYLFLWFSLYDKHAFPFYGVKIVFAIIAFILFLRYCNQWAKGEKIKLADKVTKIFSTSAVSGSIIEITIFAFLNPNIYIYTSLAAVFACLLSSGAINSLYALVFRIISHKSDLEESVTVFYLSLTFKVLYTIFFFFSSVVFVLILNYVRIREEAFLNLNSDETLSEIIGVNSHINQTYKNAFLDLKVYDRIVKNNLNQNQLDINSLRTYINNRIQYLDYNLSNNYKSVSININREFLTNNSPASLSILRNTNNVYSTATSYNFPSTTLMKSNDFYSIISYDNEGDISVYSYYPLELNNRQLGHIIANADIMEYFKYIESNPYLSSWNYINYKLNNKNIVYAKDRRFLNQNVLNILGSSENFSKYIMEFENQLNEKPSFITPTFDMNNEKTVAIMFYMKDLDSVIVFYKDINSIIKYSNIEKTITLFIIVFFIGYSILSYVYILILRLTFTPIKTANASTVELREQNRDLRKRIMCKNNDEIGLLVYNFNLFINDLELIIDNLKLKSENLINDVNNVEKIMTENSNSVNIQTESIKKSVENIQSIIASIKNITSSTEQQRTAFSSASVAVDELLQTVYRINNNIEMQSSSVEQTSASVEEMISNITSIAKSTSNADALFKKLLVEAGDGADIVEEVIESIRNVEASSEQIKNIINIIQNIAEQTNLLAMNASIEASHAGEMGRGFSVIADEIRSLAEHTAENTKSITTIIKEITRRIEESVELANNSGQSLSNIVSISESASRIVSEINTANSELEIGGKDILETITKLNATTSGVKDSVKEQINSGDAVDSQITLLDKINKEVVNIVEANSMEVNEVNDSLTSLNSISTQIIENKDRFYNMTNRLNNNFTIFNTLLMNFITNRDDEKNEEETKNALLKDDKFNIDKEIDSQLKTLEDELKISEEDDEEVIRTLKEDFKNPKMFY